MGNIFWPSKKTNATTIKVIVQGLRKAGKRTIMHKFQFDRGMRVLPFGEEGQFMMEMSYRNLLFLVYDVAKNLCLAELYASTYTATDALIFVVDSNDRENLQEARDLLQQTVQHKLLENIPVLVLANKCDFPSAVPHLKMIELLELYKVPQNCSLFSVCGDNGTGLYESLDWLSDALKQNRKS